MKNIIQSACKCIPSAKLFLALLLVSMSTAFADIGALQAAVTTELSGLKAAIIAIGIILVGVAVVIGCVRIFKGMGKSL
jgi:hypothetical protein